MHLNIGGENVQIISDFGSKLDSWDLRDAEKAQAILAAALAFEEEEDRAWALSEVVKKLACLGKIEDVEQLAETITLPYEKANAFIEIAKQLRTQNEVARALNNLTAAELAAESGKANWFWQTAENFARIGQVFEDANNHAEALRLWEKAIQVSRAGEQISSHDSEECSSVLWEVAEYLALAGEVEKASSLAASIRTERKRNHAVIAVAKIAGGDRDARHKWD